MSANAQLQATRTYSDVKGDSVGPRTATVTQINQYIKKCFDVNTIFQNVWIKGEISNFKRHYSGHLYLSLKDEGSVIKAVMFKGATVTLAFSPEDGAKVLARGRIAVYEARGEYQLYIEEMVPEGLGDLHVAFEKLKKELSEAGWFDELNKKPLPKFPRTVGVATATTGAAVRDIINVITRRYPLAEILICPTQVQGKNAASDVVRSIEYFNKYNLCDVLIVGRGGGSIEDLWAFNEREVAEAIYNSEIPIISAVGHETDFTIADFVADLRAPTPSAAAEVAVPSITELAADVLAKRALLARMINNKIGASRLRLERLKLPHPKDKIQEKCQRVDNILSKIEHLTKLKLSSSNQSFAALCASLNALSPLAVMGRGYGIASDANGTVIKSVKQIGIGDEFRLRLDDGVIQCKALSEIALKCARYKESPRH